MKWDDLVDGEWRILSEPREKSNAGNLRLPQTVLAIIDTLSFPKIISERIGDVIRPGLALL